MCIICVEWQKGNITSKEAMRNIGEALLVADSQEAREHFYEVTDMILDKELPSSEVDEEIDERWWKETHDPHE